MNNIDRSELPKKTTLPLPSEKQKEIPSAKKALTAGNEQPQKPINRASIKGPQPLTPTQKIEQYYQTVIKNIPQTTDKTINKMAKLILKADSEFLDPEVMAINQMLSLLINSSNLTTEFETVLDELKLKTDDLSITASDLQAITNKTTNIHPEEKKLLSRIFSIANEISSNISTDNQINAIKKKSSEYKKNLQINALRFTLNNLKENLSEKGKMAVESAVQYKSQKLIMSSIKSACKHLEQSDVNALSKTIDFIRKKEEEPIIDALLKDLFLSSSENSLNPELSSLFDSKPVTMELLQSTLEKGNLSENNTKILEQIISSSHTVISSFYHEEHLTSLDTQMENWESGKIPEDFIKEFIENHSNGKYPLRQLLDHLNKIIQESISPYEAIEQLIDSDELGPYESDLADQLLENLNLLRVSIQKAEIEKLMSSYEDNHNLHPKTLESQLGIDEETNVIQMLKNLKIKETEENKQVITDLIQNIQTERNQTWKLAAQDHLITLSLKQSWSEEGKNLLENLKNMKNTSDRQEYFTSHQIRVPTHERGTIKALLLVKTTPPSGKFYLSDETSLPEEIKIQLERLKLHEILENGANWLRNPVQNFILETNTTNIDHIAQKSLLRKSTKIGKPSLPLFIKRFRSKITSSLKPSEKVVSLKIPLKDPDETIIMRKAQNNMLQEMADATSNDDLKTLLKEVITSELDPKTRITTFLNQSEISISEEERALITLVEEQTKEVPYKDFLYIDKFCEKNKKLIQQNGVIKLSRRKYRNLDFSYILIQEGDNVDIIPCSQKGTPKIQGVVKKQNVDEKTIIAKGGFKVLFNTLNQKYLRAKFKTLDKKQLSKVKLYKMLPKTPHIAQTHYGTWISQKSGKKQLGIFPVRADGDLDTFFDKSNKFNEKTLKGYFLQMAQGIQEMHQVELLHLDIKPLNFLFRKEKDGTTTIMVSDFDTMVKVEKNKRITGDGTDIYQAPEQLNRQLLDPLSEDAYACDIYQLGKTFLEIYGKCAEKKDYEGELAGIMQKMLHPDPNQRLSIDEVVDFLMA